MTPPRELVEQWASQISPEGRQWRYKNWILTPDELDAIAALAMQHGAEQEREACARMIEPKNAPDDWTEYARVRADCAAAIRARTDAKGSE